MKLERKTPMTFSVIDTGKIYNAYYNAYIYMTDKTVNSAFLEAYNYFTTK
jgi:hypothetical protein